MEDLIIITGPTGAGKTDISIKIAKEAGCEIISADSRQVYKHMTIGTAKVTEDEMQGVKHHLVDFVDLDNDYTAFDFSKDAKKLIDDNSNKIVVGGTLFYIKALIQGDLKAPKVSQELKETLEKEYEANAEKLYEELQNKDANAAKKIHVNDSYRVVRALSVIRETGKPYSSFKEPSKNIFNPIYYIVGMPREELYDRINRRVDKMVESGLFDEVQGILNLGYDKNLKALNTLGYKEVIEHFDGVLTKDECISKIKQESRHFAKRQLTWLRSLGVEQISTDEIYKRAMKKF